MAETIRRYFIIFMVVLFLVTSVGLGVVGFWQSTKNDNGKQDETATTENADCALGSVPGQQSLAAPEAFKPEGDVTQLKIEDLEPGTGAALKPGDCVTVKYHGTLATSGEKFDGNFDTPNGLKFPLGQGQVITGWDQGLVGMKLGGTRRLVIPSDLAYRDQAAGSIPPNSDLVFVVKALAAE